MVTTNNLLVQVKEYNKSGLALLSNLMPIASKMMNRKFQNFQDQRGNLGSATLLSLPSRFGAAQGLVANFQGVQMNQQTLTCDQAVNVAYGFNAQDRLFTVDKPGVSEYMDSFGSAAMAEIATYMEANLALHFASAAPVNTIIDNQTVATGALHTESGPFRFANYISGLTTMQQLNQIVEDFLSFGAAKGNLKCALPNNIYPAIVQSGFTQFATNRNNEMANSWDMGKVDQCEFYKSNLLPTHISGTVGNASGSSNQLTVVSTDDPTGQLITQITFSGAGVSDPVAILSGDRAQAVDGVSGKTNQRFLTYTGGILTTLPTQFRVIGNAASDGSGNVTVSIYPYLSVQKVPKSSDVMGINTNILAGMKFAFVPNHRVACLMSGDPFYLSNPMLPDLTPFPSASAMHPDTRLTLQTTYGTLFGQNFQGYVTQTTWGAILTPAYSEAILLPA